MAEQNSGKIINVASMLAFQGGKFVPSYTASKHGIAGITKAFANELACKNIQINAIAPGYIKTANTAPIRSDEKRNAEILSRIPAEKWADPFDLMGTIVFLASRASDYVNGHILVTKNGELVNMDSSGNRVAAMIFGPRKVIIVVGVNKVVDDLDEAFKRLKKIAPMNAIRVKHHAPCVETGKCMNCESKSSVCNYIGIVNNGLKDQGRITVIMVAEELGF